MTTSAAALHAIPRMNAGWCRISKRCSTIMRQLTHVYVEAYQVTGDDHYRRVACETLDYILKEMTSPEGGFIRPPTPIPKVWKEIFVWTPEEVRVALDNEEDARRVCAYYDVTEAGNWEHKNVLHTHSLEAVAKDLRLSADELRQTIDKAKPRLYAARARRVPPGLDDKVITAWNGMMIRAMAEASRVFGVERYREAAQRACDFR